MAQHKKPLANISHLLEALPTFPSEIYDTLPSLLKRGTDAFTTGREKDVFLAGSLVVFGGFLDNTLGTYQRELVHPNINAFVVAPASNGKSTFKHAKAYGAKAHRILCEQSKALAKEYFLQRQKLKTSGSQDMKDPLAPPFKTGYVPGDITSAALVQRMQDNGGKGVIFESEADPISSNLRKEHGGHDAIFRQTFHHETVSVARKAMNEVIEIERPRLSIGTTGTPDQVMPLISSIENGLFSRFCFYFYSQKSKWKRLSDQSKDANLTEYFKAMEEEAYAAIKFSSENPTMFSLSSKQEIEFDEHYEQWLLETGTAYGKDAEAIIYRMGLNTFRIAMILTTLRKAEAQNKSKDIICTEADFKTAMALAKVFKEHALFLYSQFTEPKVVEVQDILLTKLYGLLPLKFQRKEAVAIAHYHGIAPDTSSTCDNYLRKMVDKGLIRNLIQDGAKHFGHYEKVEV